MNFLPKLAVDGHKELLVLNAPAELMPFFQDLPGVSVRTSPEGMKRVDWVLSFVKKDYEVEKTLRLILGKVMGDVTLWFAFPKQASEKHESEINEAKSWRALGKAGFDGVRGTALDADWSALRFRKNQYISKMTRNADWILSREGKRRAGDRNPPADDGFDD